MKHGSSWDRGLGLPDPFGPCHPWLQPASLLVAARPPPNRRSVALRPALASGLPLAPKWLWHTIIGTASPKCQKPDQCWTLRERRPLAGTAFSDGPREHAPVGRNPLKRSAERSEL